MRLAASLGAIIVPFSAIGIADRCDNVSRSAITVVAVAVVAAAVVGNIDYDIGNRGLFWTFSPLKHEGSELDFPRLCSPACLPACH